MAGFFERHRGVYWYIPNLIGARCAADPSPAGRPAAPRRPRRSPDAHAPFSSPPTQATPGSHARCTPSRSRPPGRCTAWSSTSSGARSAAGGSRAARRPRRAESQLACRPARQLSRRRRAPAAPWPLRRFVCDELDGRFARKFKQTSTLGAVLDMVTDRCARRGGTSLRRSAPATRRRPGREAASGCCCRLGPQLSRPAPSRTRPGAGCPPRACWRCCASPTPARWWSLCRC
jgi:hypothetical protein